jgi:hypothetical protein
MDPALLLGSTMLTWFAALSVAAVVVYYLATRTDIPKIKGIPEIPAALPMYAIHHG